MKKLHDECVLANLYVEVRGQNLFVDWRDCEENKARELLRKLKENKKEFIEYLNNMNLRPPEKYELNALIKYYELCGWRGKAKDIATDFLAKDAYMPEHEHRKYLQVLEKGFFDETVELAQ